MTRHEAAQKRARLSVGAARRYVERQRPRTPKLQEAEETGVLAAAGMNAASRRTAHMARAEGRALMVDVPPVSAAAIAAAATAAAGAPTADAPDTPAAPEGRTGSGRGRAAE